MTNWVTRQGSSISVEPIGELRAVHLDASGMTHLVDLVSAEVLVFLASGPHPPRAILEKLASISGGTEPSWDDVEESLLFPLAAVGLIEAVA